jgi:hypothetical protein
MTQVTSGLSPARIWPVLGWANAADSSHGRTPVFGISVPTRGRSEYSAAFEAKMLAGRSANSLAQEIGANQPTTLEKWLSDAGSLQALKRGVHIAGQANA